MTEAEWLDCPNPETHYADPELMLGSLPSAPSERKLRLLAFASCSLISDRLRYPQSTTAIEVLGRYAENLASLEDLATAAEGAWYVVAKWSLGPWSPSPEDGEKYNAYMEQWKAHEAVAWAVTETNLINTTLDNVTNALVRAEMEWESCFYIHDIFGNPFRPIAVDPGWFTSTVVALAEGIYQERAFDRMPILADALEDAGCDNPDVLNHCRGEGPHVRGCWVVDLLTGRK